jgi:8-oxo-dGTP diphosphatase
MSVSEQEIINVFGNKLRCRVGGVCIENNQILLIKHTNLGTNGYLWSPPGGGIHFGESAKEALKREFLEETGFAVSVGKFLYVNEFLSPPLHAIELFFEVKIISGTLKTGTDPEMKDSSQIIQKVEFLSIKDIKNEPKASIHNMFKTINSLDDILEFEGFWGKGDISE